MHAMIVDTFVPMLGTLSNLLERARAHARANARDLDALFGATLAPGMYGLGLQVRVVCDHVIDSTARLTGEQPPRRDHDGETLDALQTSIASAITFVRSVPAERFAGAAEHIVRMPLQDGLVMEMTGERFGRDWALPVFYFHVVLAYGMLRHEGVEIGIREYLAHIGDAIRPIQ